MAMRFSSEQAQLYGLAQEGDEAARQQLEASLTPDQRPFYDALQNSQEGGPRNFAAAQLGIDSQQTDRRYFRDPDAERYQRQYQAEARDVAGMDIDRSRYEQTRGLGMDARQRMLAELAGYQSIAPEMAQQGSEMMRRQALASAAAASPAQRGVAMHLAQQGLGAGMVDVAGQAQQQRLAEHQQQLQALAGVRQQDVGAAGLDLRDEAQRQTFQTAKDRLAQQYLMAGEQRSRFATDMGALGEETEAARHGAVAQRQAQQAAQSREQWGGFFDNLGNASAAVGQYYAQQPPPVTGARGYKPGFATSSEVDEWSMCDKRAKKNIRSGEGAAEDFLSRDAENYGGGRAPMPEVEAFLESAKPKTFEYRGSEEERLGVMAQDLERSPMGASIVVRQPWPGQAAADAAHERDPRRDVTRFLAPEEHAAEARWPGLAGANERAARAQGDTRRAAAEGQLWEIGAGQQMDRTAAAADKTRSIAGAKRVRDDRIRQVTQGLEPGEALIVREGPENYDWRVRGIDGGMRAIDTRKAVPAILAGLGALHKRMQAVEQKKGK